MSREQGTSAQVSPQVASHAKCLLSSLCVKQFK